MSTALPQLHDELIQTLRRTRGDVSFAQFLDGRALSDEDLTDLIDLDGHTRIEMNSSVILQDYLDAVPGLADRSDPIDAAIEVTIRSLSRGLGSVVQAVQTLVENYPGLAAQIRETAALDAAIGSTTLVNRSVSPRRRKSLPCGFGPSASDGERRYELRELLGSGVHGDVYLAVDRVLSDVDKPALVAIKVFPPSDRSAWAKQRFIDEATKARRIDHPGVVRVLDRGASEIGEDYVVYEYVDGGSLDVWVLEHARKLDVRAAVALAAKIARGVEAAHAAGLVHCDIKPANIILTGAGEPKVADFGVAIRSGDDLDAFTPDDERPVGNLAFMSPQQHRMEEGSLSAASDIYAVGGILFWLLVGRNPNGQSAAEIAAAHDAATGRVEAPSPRESRRDVDRDLDAICRRAIAPRVAGRYTAAGMLAEDLEGWLRREPIRWNNPSAARKVSLWARRGPVAAVLSLAIVALLIAGYLGMNHIADVIRAKDLQVAESAATAAELQSRNDRILHGIPIILGAHLGIGRPDGRAAERLAAMEVLKVASGLVDTDNPEVELSFREAQIRVLDGMISECPGNASQAYVLPLVWRTLMGILFVMDEQYERGELTLGACEFQLRRKTSPQDPLFETIELVRACALVGRLSQPPFVLDPTRDDFPEIESALRRGVDAPPSVQNIEIRRLAAKHLAILLGVEPGTPGSAGETADVEPKQTASAR